MLLTNLADKLHEFASEVSFDIHAITQVDSSQPCVVLQYFDVTRTAGVLQVDDSDMFRSLKNFNVPADTCAIPEVDSCYVLQVLVYLDVPFAAGAGYFDLSCVFRYPKDVYVPMDALAIPQIDNYRVLVVLEYLDVARTLGVGDVDRLYFERALKNLNIAFGLGASFEIQVLQVRAAFEG